MNPLMVNDDQTNTFRQTVVNFVNNWHNGFVLDYWWRHKYKVPFGSPQHRAMNFIDMLIEYREEMIVREIRDKREAAEDELLGLNLEDGKEVVKMSQDEIDDDYENLNIEEYGRHNNRH